MRLRRGFLTPLVVLATAVLLLGCGSDDGSERELEGEPFTSDELADWTGALDQIDQYNADGECEDADSKLATLRGEVEKSGSDEGLKADLITLLDGLDAKLAEDCAVEPEVSSTTTSDETEEAPSTTTTTTTTEEEPTTTEDDAEEDAEEEPVEPTTSTPEPEAPEGPPITPPGQGGVPPGEQGGIAPEDFESDRKSPTS